MDLCNRNHRTVLALIGAAWLSHWSVCTQIRAQPHEPGQPQPNPQPAPLWYTIEFDGDVEDDDKELARTALERGASSLLSYFDDPTLTDTLSAVSVNVTIHAEPGPRASESKASVHSGTQDGSFGTYYASVHVLAPASYSAGVETSIGEPKDTEYFKRLLIHELSTVPLDLATRVKGTGWRFHTGPQWFVQGYQEYLGMAHSPGEMGSEALERRTRIVAAEPERVDDSFGLDVKGPYVTGAVLVRFMHEQYGPNRVKGILRSQEPTFGRAARASLGVTLDEFMRDWRAWLTNQSTQTPKP